MFKKEITEDGIFDNNVLKDIINFSRTKFIRKYEISERRYNSIRLTLIKELQVK